VRKVTFEDNGLEDLTYWAKTDLKILKKVIVLSENIAKTPFEGLGKPEPLKGDLQGFWSRRITDEHRLVYAVTKDAIIIIACRRHYE
jgi:toxin YoeB